MGESNLHASTRGLSNPQSFFAHSLAGLPPEHWEPLETHLKRVADGHDLRETRNFDGAAAFARPFGGAPWARLAALWHDVGKYAPRFQQYLRQTAELADDDPHRAELRGTVDHATAGAVHAVRQLGPIGRVLAYCIAGHHGGLPNSDAGQGAQERSGLTYRLQHPPAEAEEALRHAPRGLLEQAGPPMPPLELDREDGRRFYFQLAFFTRMLFSCLVDADFLATEVFMNPGRAAARPPHAPSLSYLAGQLDNHVDELGAAARRQDPDSVVQARRAEVLRWCRDAAERRPGFFSLTVPTGGGKTLSALSFALRHAVSHGQQRVIVAIPFTSIIEQNAAVYRRALGELGSHVVEHHSNLDPREERESNRLAAENWDAPLIVTTNVQLLESLFASRTSRCRKLHRIANSVIVLDEAQALPPNLLAPTLAALQELVTNYRCTVVLCTATQPALERRSDFAIGLDDVEPIVPAEERDRLFDSLERVAIEQAGPVPDEAMVERLAGEQQVLCIVNTRDHAADLFGQLTQRLEETEAHGPDDSHGSRVSSCLHLSANMCPRHRAAVLRLIRRRLETGRPCRVVSTQLVEAGVDVDFPVVYRAEAGLDAIAQAAGRCNREGRRDELGRVIVFGPDTEQRRLPQFVRRSVQDARQVLPDHPNPLTPEAQHAYFALHYWQRGGDDGRGWDRPPQAGQGAAGVLGCFADAGQTLQFRQAAERYRLIADDQQTILIPYGRRGRQWMHELETIPTPPDRAFNRRLQRLGVGVYQRIAEQLAQNNVLAPAEQRHGRLVLANPAAYDRRLGLRRDRAGWAPEMLQI